MCRELWGVGRGLRWRMRRWIVVALKRKLKAAGTWRDMTPRERTKPKKVIPVAVLLTRKRGCAFMARAIAPGKLWRNQPIFVLGKTPEAVRRRP